MRTHQASEALGSNRRRFFGWTIDVLSVALLLLATTTFVKSHFFQTARATRARPTHAFDSTYLPIQVASFGGTREKLLAPPRARGLLLFIFRSDCHVCGVQKPQWLELDSVARANNVLSVAVTLEDLKPAVKNYFAPATIRVVKAEDAAAALSALHTNMVPTTILVTRGNKVAVHEIGLLDGAQVTRLKGLLGG